MTKPVLLLDVDGVVIDYHGLYIQRAIEFAFVTPEQAQKGWTEWDVQKALGLSDAADRQIVHGFPDILQPFPGAIEAVHRLMLDTELVFVTAPHKFLGYWAHNRKRWLQHHFGPGVRVISASGRDKALVRGDVFVDDRPRNVECWYQANAHDPNKVAVLWEQPYNQRQRPGGCWATNSWERLALLCREMV